MSCEFSPSRQATGRLWSPAGVRPLNAGRWGGNHYAILCRHEEDCARYGRLNSAERGTFHSKLLRRIAKTDNLRVAVEHIVTEGGGAPGPNGQCLALLWHERQLEVFEELRRLQQAIQTGTYVPARARIKRIPKRSGGTRPLSILNWQDAVVQRAIVQILQPIVDPRLCPTSFAFRPGRGLQDALANAESLALREGRLFWVTADIQDAFGHVPHRDLIHVVQKQFSTRGAETSGELHPIASLIQTIIHAGSTAGLAKGISQGGSLSPMLLNWLLHHRLDEKWAHRGIETLNLRYADDILLLCRNAEEAEGALEHLRALLQPLGMRLKGKPDHQTANLLTGEAADWLGLSMRLRGEALSFQPREAFLEDLEDDLIVLKEEADGVLRIPAAIEGTLDQLGMCYDHADRGTYLRRTRRIMQTLGVSSCPSPRDLERRWELSSTRFQCHRKLIRCLSEDAGEGKESCIGFAKCNPTRLLHVADNRPAPAGRAAESRPSAPIILTVTTSRTSEGSGVFGYAVCSDEQRRPVCHFRSVRGPISAYRLSLMGLAAAIDEVIRRSSEGEWLIRTDSEPVRLGLQELLPQWIATGGRTTGGAPVKNWDLWETLHGKLTGRRYLVQRSIDPGSDGAGGPELECGVEPPLAPFLGRSGMPIMPPYVGGRMS